MQSSIEVSLPLASCRQRGQGGSRHQDRHDTTGSAGRKPGCRKGRTARPSSGCTAGGPASHTWTLKHTYTYYYICLYTHTHKTPWKMLAITLKQRNHKENADLDSEVRAHTHTHTHTHSDIYNIYTQNPMETADRDPKATE